MKERLNIGVLVTARDEYMSYLKKQLSPHILNGLVSIYNDAVETQVSQNSYKFNKQFQIFLKAIPQWNQTVLITETKRILGLIDHLQKLVTAIFLSEVKILTSIRLGGDGKNIEIRVTPTDLLIHRIYINVAKVIYNSVELLESFSDIENKQYIIKDIIEKIIGETVIELIPIKKILDEYLNTVLTDISRDCESDSDSETDSGAVHNEPETDNELSNNFGSEATPVEFNNSTPAPETIENIEKLIDSTIEQNNAIMEDYNSITAADPNAPTIKISESGGNSFGSGFGSMFGFGTDEPNSENIESTEPTEPTENDVYDDFSANPENTETPDEPHNDSLFGEAIKAIKEENEPKSDNGFSFGSNISDPVTESTEYALPDISNSEAPTNFDSFF